MAEAVCAHLLQQRGIDDWQVDSAGTSAWHIGEVPDPRTIAACKAHTIPIQSRARQVHSKDFLRFDYILAMDESNLDKLRRFKHFAKTQVALLGDYDPQGQLEVGDPYYGGDDGFERVYQHVYRCCVAFLDAEA